MAEQKNIFTGTTEIMEDKAIAISIERYNELIRKETLFDKITEGKGINIYLYAENVGGAGNA